MSTEKMTVLLGDEISISESVSLLLTLLPFSSLVYFEDGSYQVLGTSTVPKVEYSPRLFEFELSDFIEKNLSVYTRFISLNDKRPQNFERFW